MTGGRGSSDRGSRVDEGRSGARGKGQGARGKGQGARGTGQGARGKGPSMAMVCQAASAWLPVLMLVGEILLYCSAGQKK